MFRPDSNRDRTDYSGILMPPDGYRLDRAVGTTYSLDLEALTAVAICLGLSEETDSTGKGKIAVKPDKIRLYVNKEELCKEYEDTLRRSTEDTELLKDLFEKLGFQRKDLKTVYFNVDTEYESY